MMQEQPESVQLPYKINGIVVYGQQFGRKLGFPTANVQISEEDSFPLSYGVYVVISEIGSRRFSGIANAGIRPTIDGSKFQLEVHLFDFQEDVYGKNILVTFLHWIREERRFNEIHQLVQQIDKDIVQAKQFLLTLTPGYPTVF
jgi:riboflavin kinase/FMN adenylyltransferase